ncbi:MAG: MFS transporter [Anaerolineales bacterium]|nr:MFS transporter [Anaerolineales bacterium]
MTDKNKPILGEVAIAAEVTTNQMEPGRIRYIILLLSASVALMMTGYGIVMPVFARRLGEFGDGVEALGLLTMSFAMAQLIAAPMWGGVADRRGRRPIILLALTATTLAYIGYLLAPNTTIFVVIRAMAGFMTAGLFPAAMGVVADIVPGEQRARWVGIVMGSYAVGMIFGPALGGFLYDGWGYAAPFVLSAVVAFLALLAAFIMIPETRTPEIRWRETLKARRTAPLYQPKKQSLWAVLPHPLHLIGTLLFIDFVGSFGFAFVEPQMIFYFYDTLDWTTLQFGIVVGVYGVVMVIGQMFLGQLSDKWGRKPIIVAGLFPNILFFAGLAVITDFYTMMIGAALAGLGNALLSPAISAFYFDITAVEHRSRLIGVKESSLALGGVLGPLAVAAMAGFVTPQGIFWIASGLALVTLFLGLIFLREPQHTQTGSLSVQEEISSQRALAAQASLRGIVMLASSARVGNRKEEGFSSF